MIRWKGYNLREIQYFLHLNVTGLYDCKVGRRNKLIIEGLVKDHSIYKLNLGDFIDSCHKQIIIIPSSQADYHNLEI